MKFLKPFLIIVTILTLSLTFISSYGISNHSASNELNGTNQKIDKKIAALPTTPSPLHGDVWFAFSAIGFMGVYLAIKK